MNKIKEVLDSKGIKQTWLADKLGKSYNMVNSYVQNRQQPRLEVLYQIAEILEVEVKELLMDSLSQVAEPQSRYQKKK
jgi:transcriptional regulator with XRE-family HTH domain